MATDRNQRNETMTNTQDQVRQNMAATRATVEQVDAQARQATRESLVAVQQVSQQAAFTSERLSQQGGQMATTAFGAAWDSWLATLGMVSWTQDQAEKVTRQLMEQGRVSREEGLRLTRDLLEQVKRNQAELQRMIQEGVRVNLQSYQVPEAAMKSRMTSSQANPTDPASAITTPATGTGATPSISLAQFEDLNRKVDDLNRKLDALNITTSK